jgi:hypothetical protein
MIIAEAIALIILSILILWIRFHSPLIKFYVISYFAILVLAFAYVVFSKPKKKRR